MTQMPGPGGRYGAGFKSSKPDFARREFPPAEIPSLRTMPEAAAVRASESTHHRAGPLLPGRMFSSSDRHPFDEIEWDKRTIVIKTMNGATHEETDCEFPVFWSVNASNIAGAKYFRGRIGTSAREHSVKQMIGRVVKTIQGWGLEFGYFASSAEAALFADELAAILLHQRAAFNSPVWFNVGIEARPQCSACFILEVEDNMQSILDWISTEGKIFKGGSGSGVNLSPLRSSFETLSAGGRASGPVSFMRGADSVAGMIASGGSTRRAAKMVVLNTDHPDIVKFIRCKAEEEDKVRALMAAGFNMQDLNDEAWRSVQYQNANNSVRVTDEFMHAVEADALWQTRLVTSGEVAEEHRARDVMREIAAAAWKCGDPGIMFDTTVNRWNTVANTARIHTTNPCGEYVHINNSACNLSSINLLRYLGEDRKFRLEEFLHTVRVMILAQEIIVDGSRYPTERIAKNAHDFRELGLGYANLGAFLMALGLPYDSPEARSTAAALTSLMTGEAYRYSAVLAGRMGPFAGFAQNREPMLRVLGMHRNAMPAVERENVFDERVWDQALRSWDEAIRLASMSGVRNSQVSLIAPTGTIAFMMDCDTTGVEPDFALVKMKSLVGGGKMKIVNRTVPRALRKLGYAESEIQEIVEHIEKQGTIEGAPGIRSEHLAVFDCAVKPQNGTRSISWEGHVRMVAAVQPFVSGGISKTFNMSSETTVEEIIDAYMMAWKLGIKAFAVYRDGSKATQPLVTVSSKTGPEPKAAVEPTLPFSPQRRYLPTTHVSETHKFSIVGHEGYLTYSAYEDGTLAEIFIRMAKQGSTLAGLLDAFAISVSVALQYGVPLKDLARKFIYGRYEPAGFTENPAIQVATSITDYIFRYLSMRFLAPEDLMDLGINGHGPQDILSDPADPASVVVSAPKIEATKAVVYADSVCRKCGGMMVQTGSCKTCLQCGDSSGGCA